MGSISLIVPCWNGEKYLAEFLHSLLAQSRMPDEFFFVNDGSTDDTEELFLSFAPRIEKKGTCCNYLKVAHGGQAAAISAGLEAFAGDYLIWADSDDVLHPDALRAKASFLDAHPETAWVRNDAYYWRDAEGSVTGTAALPKDCRTQNLFEALLTEQTYVLAGCYMMRRELFLSCYPQRRIPNSAEGQNLQMLMPPASREDCGFINRPLLSYRIHAGSHAHASRSVTEQLARAESFARLKRELLAYCDCKCDRERCIELIGETFEKTRRAICYSVALSHRSRMAQEALEAKGAQMMRPPAAGSSEEREEQ